MAGEILTAEANATVSLSPVAIDPVHSANSSLGGIPTLVSFSNINVGQASEAGTITQINDESWAALGYAVGEGIFVGSPTNSNTNGATFNPTGVNPYYTIAAISGATLTLKAGEVLATENLATVNLSPVAISGMNGSTSTSTGVSTQVKSLTSIESTDPAHGGDDTISGAWAAGAAVATNVTFGNSGNAGTITLASGTWQAAGYGVGNGIYVAGNGANGNGATFNGDNYYTIAAINGATLTLKAGESLTAAAGVVDLSLVKATPAGAGNNIVIGGVGADTIDIGGASNTVLGDDGRATYDGATGKLTSIKTADPAAGGNDVIDVSGGGNAILGGFGADLITVGGPTSTILGDNGSATFDAGTGLITNITTFTGLVDDVPSDGGNDIINVSSGGNVIIGGVGADAITIGGGGNVVLGDNGYANFTAAGVLTFITTTDQTVGGDDVIKIDGSGNNEILGGSGADTITVNGTGQNVIFGDNGDATFDVATGNLTKIETIGETSAASGATASVESSTSGTIYGGDDTIKIGNGNTGGGAASAPHHHGAQSASSSGNIIVGDDGIATFTAGVLTHIETSDPSIGGDDLITTGDGNNVIVGGFGADQITVGDGNNIILGDNGKADLSALGILASIQTTDPVFGGEDVIKTGNGRNIVLGGSAGDDITTGTGNNVILGDNGIATFTAGILTVIQSTDTSVGGDDTIKTGGGNNVVIGGLGADAITTFGGNDVILGDSGYAQFSNTGNLLIIYTTSPDATLGGTKDTGTTSNDVINAGDGDNVVVGGAAATDHHRVEGRLILGDNVWTSPVGAVRTPNHAKHRSTFGGDDVIHSGSGNDLIFSETGNDLIYG